MARRLLKGRSLLCCGRNSVRPTYSILALSLDDSEDFRSIRKPPESTTGAKMVTLHSIYAGGGFGKGGF
jgi:hypothetical protein